MCDWQFGIPPGNNPAIQMSRGLTSVLGQAICRDPASAARTTIEHDLASIAEVERRWIEIIKHDVLSAGDHALRDFIVAADIDQTDIAIFKQAGKFSGAEQSNGSRRRRF